jgi:hypothetical protein
MGILFANHAKSFLVEAVDDVSTEIKVTKPEVYTFPNIDNSDDFFFVSAIGSSTQPALEIMKVIGVDKSAGILTVVRGVDGTAPKQLSSGLSLEIRLTAAALNVILAIANEGLDGPKLERFDFAVESSVWEVNHGRGTTLFDEKLLVLDSDGVYRKHLAPTEIIDEDSFRIRFSHAVSGYVDIRF